MRTDKTARRRTWRLCVTVFILTALALMTGLALLMVDRATGTVLFGEAPDVPLPEAVVPVEWLPPRLQVLWALVDAFLSI